MSKSLDTETPRLGDTAADIATEAEAAEEVEAEEVEVDEEGWMSKMSGTEEGNK